VRGVGPPDAARLIPDSPGPGAPIGPVPIRPGLATLSGYHSPQVDVAVRLNTNESPLPPPPGFRTALEEACRAVAFNRYPDRAATALREAIAAHHGVEPSQVFCANGSNEVLQCLLLAYGGPGRTAALFEPTYTLHGHIARVTGTAVAVGARAADFRLDLPTVRRVLAESSPVVTFLCSPNNPTGVVDTPEEIGAVLDAAPGLVVVDEAYGQFARTSCLDLLAAAKPGAERAVVVRTFSKTWSMAALRLGYLIASPEVVEACELVVLPYHLDALKQAAGTIALGFAAEMAERVASVMEERGRVAARLATLPVETWPSEANFILFRPTGRDARRVWTDLVERSVLVRDCSTWAGTPGCLRVTVGTAAENDAFLDALEKAL